jgi:hypothetical protein
MSNRSANESIKGYIYQFDRSMIEILECENPNTEFVVEGVEDIDVIQSNLSTFIQYKYYEGTEYNHSEIKPAVISMLRHFVSLNTPQRSLVKYKIYGHFKSGQEKLKENFDVEFLKKRFLSYKKDKLLHTVQKDLGIDDTSLNHFKSALIIDINARSYEDQRAYITNELLKKQIPTCSTIDDAQMFFYPSATTAIQSLAIQKDVKKRRITKIEMIKIISNKEIVFNLWMRKSLDIEKYAKAIKKNHFLVKGTKRQKAARVFLIEVPLNFDLSKISEILTKISEFFTHKEYNRTVQSDRYCPFVVLRQVSEEGLITIKEQLYSQGVLFDDGYPFRGAKLDVKKLAQDPTDQNLYKLKIIDSETEISGVFKNIEGAAKKMYDFYVTSRTPKEYQPHNTNYTAISIEDPSVIAKMF